MSCILCDDCERLIDSDDDPACFCEPPEDVPFTPAQRAVLSVVLCESCRENRWEREQARSAQ